jgi:hypothetical protein
VDNRKISAFSQAQKLAVQPSTFQTEVNEFAGIVVAMSCICCQQWMEGISNK